MEIIEICPLCSNVGIKIEEVTLKSMITENMKKEIIPDSEYYICSNPNCTVSYFCENNYFTVNDIKVSIWFKDSGLDVPICYCSNLTRGEIINAVKNGCKTIDEVQEYTGKNITGKCVIKNPLGKCCRNVFLKTIEQGKL